MSGNARRTARRIAAESEGARREREEHELERQWGQAPVTPENRSLHQQLLAAGVELDSHESDLYAKVTPESRRIVERSGAGATTFTGLDGEPWFDLPFAYEPYWARKQRRASGGAAGGDAHDTELLEAFGAGELLPLVRGGTLRLIGGDPDEEWGELEFVIEGLGDQNPLEGTQYLLKVHRDEDLATEGEHYRPGEGPHQKYNVETDVCADGCPMGGQWEEGFDTADEAIAWIDAKIDSRPEDNYEDGGEKDGDGGETCPACGGDAERTPEGLLACPDCDYIGRERL